METKLHKQIQTAQVSREKKPERGDPETGTELQLSESNISGEKKTREWATLIKAFT